MSIRLRAGALAICLPLVLVACGDDDNAASPAGTPTGTQPSASESNLDDGNAWALQYTGGKAGEASGTPYKIGYVNEDAFLPASTIGAKAAVEYVNKELGGVGGRPLELVSCAPSSAEETAQCGARLANDPSVSLVLLGTLDKGNKELYDAIGGKKAILVGTPLASADFVTPNAVSYTAGSPGVLIGMALTAVKELKAKTVAVVIPDTPSGRAAVTQLLGPIFKGAGATVKQVFISTKATAPEMATALQATGAAKADVLVTAVPPALCINLYDAQKSLGITPKVVTTDQCGDKGMQAHLKTAGDSNRLPSEWYFVNYGYNYELPDVASGMATYKREATVYAKPLGSVAVELSGGFAGPGFAMVMSAVKILNQVGVDKATFASLDAALRGFTGPAMMQVGPLKCGVPPFVAVCAHQVGVSKFENGAWVNVRNGLNNQPIDLLAP